jgi:hypothetical protein
MRHASLDYEAGVRRASKKLDRERSGDGVRAPSPDATRCLRARPLLQARIAFVGRERRSDLVRDLPGRLRTKIVERPVRERHGFLRADDHALAARQNDVCSVVCQCCRHHRERDSDRGSRDCVSSMHRALPPIARPTETEPPQPLVPSDTSTAGPDESTGRSAACRYELTSVLGRRAGRSRGHYSRAEPGAERVERRPGSPARTCR